MEFHLEFSPKPLITRISHHQQLMLIGSCFTENIGEKLLAHKFNVMQNPNGILFNPVSVAEAIDNYISNKKISEKELFYLNEGFHSWQHHSRFSSPVKETSVEKINTSTEAAHDYLKTAEVLLITLGSAWVYELTEEAQNAKPGAVAANNHKAPSAWFHRRLLASEELDGILSGMMSKLHNFNPGLKVIFTISPVRHLREGFVENNRSKATLINSVHKLADSNGQVDYFPAYELVIDDLRDYRFYAEDMVHPNYAATNYVWEKFVTACIDEPTQQLMKVINEINAARSHKPFNAASEAHRNFLQKNLEKVNSLKEKYPYINFDPEKAYFSYTLQH
ncbi:GSCFA domain-containing protein [Ferruginibacter sp. HRS2-29]|uniref:GSCFA domain-containing protein n=1 Tax=Ferruginibacter sp. HRS2-29 TaxID=2487334 RepID=UPI0020CC4A9B|nr:GSCFA domain-containing protein [Ferruginibacter sp. HRS2-29]MCP9750891.1 GSCFA domain-containing protein [Ferruginibacter sp. HRS2-29]